VAEVILKDESYAVIGACFEVYNHLGAGFLEPVYHRCLEIELASLGIPFVSKPKVPIHYKGESIGCLYEDDFICYQQIILELKAVAQLAPQHEAQLMHYLKATHLPLGILLNFCSPTELQYKRIAATSRS
jgi:GxxExxY protein